VQVFNLHRTISGVAYPQVKTLRPLLKTCSHAWQRLSEVGAGFQPAQNDFGRCVSAG